MTNNRQKFWTDYPVTELGDIPHKIAPVRECKIVFWLSEKWLIAEAEGVQFETKKFYVYTKKGRAGEVPFVERKEKETRMTNLTDLCFYWFMSVLICSPIVFSVWNAIQKQELDWFMACVLLPPVAFVRGIGLYYNIW